MILIIIIYKCGPYPVYFELYPGICLTTEGKTRITIHKNYTNNQNTEQTSLKISQSKRNHNHKSQYKILQSITLSAKQHTLLFTVIKSRKQYTLHCNQNSQTQSHDQIHCTLQWLWCFTMECWRKNVHCHHTLLVSGVAEMKVHN
jgi:hypothetical protein